MDPDMDAVAPDAAAEEAARAAALEAQGGPGDIDGEPQEAITQPAKLLRIASMVRELLEETRQASLDEPGRIRLRQIYERALGELAHVLSNDLKDELATLAPPMSGIPSDAEMRVAQAQLVGWLEGLFHGIQAALFAQQAAARAQFEELRRRGLPQGVGEGQPPERAPGQYL
ncbi:MAG: proteasome activator [Actinomycetota bacterium]